MNVGTASRLLRGALCPTNLGLHFALLELFKVDVDIAAHVNVSDDGPDRR